MMKRLLAIGISLLLAVSLASCSNGNPELEPGPKADNDIEFFEENSDLTECENAEIADFIDEYNTQQSDESKRIGRYRIFYDTVKKMYYVYSSTVNLTVQLDSNGKVLSASPHGSEDITKQITVASALLDALKNRSPLSQDQKEEIEFLQSCVNDMQAIVNKRIDDFSGSQIDKTLPEPTLPELTEYEKE